MRIISGLYKGKRLAFDTNALLRPTKDRVKEACFSSLADHCRDAICLDLFAGSGSLGFEALSRGAQHVDFVDINPLYVHKNKQICSPDTSLSINKSKASAFIKKTTKKYDIIFLDPPWIEPEHYTHSLNQIFEFDILNKLGIIVCEHTKDACDFNGFDIIKQKKFGDTVLTLLRLE